MSWKPGTIILVVDPHPEPLIPLLETLAPVVTETTVAAALSAFAKYQPRLTILDYRLSEGSGLDLLAHIRLMDSRSPVVMATAAGSETVCAAAFRLGVAEYLIKPIAREQLIAVLHLLDVNSSKNGADTGRTSSPGGDGPPKRAWSEGTAAHVRQAARIIESQYEEPFSLERLASAVGMGRFELSRQFTRIMGRSIRDYLGERRIVRAKELLAATHRPITEVAQLVGYSDLPRFDKVFRAWTGCSPSEFRVAARNYKRDARNY